MSLLRRRRPGQPTPAPPQDRIAEADARIIAAATPYTLTGFERLLALVQAVEYLERRRIPGAFAECGVWRGGSVLAMALKLLDLGVDDRDVHLYDTFDGMTAPTEADTSPYDPPALVEWRAAAERGERPWPNLFEPTVFNLDAVRALLESSGYPPARLHFVPGRVEDTIPAHAPDQLALLRLDTDWYESTRHELEHLYPRLAPGGVLIIDDYGHWEGCARAVDEYFAADGREPLLLNRVDYTCRIAVKA